MMRLPPDFLDLLTVLNAADARYLLVGGHAVGFYGQEALARLARGRRGLKRLTRLRRASSTVGSRLGLRRVGRGAVRDGCIGRSHVGRGLARRDEGSTRTGTYHSLEAYERLPARRLDAGSAP